jgi:hypothetical protein
MLAAYVGAGVLAGVLALVMLPFWISVYAVRQALYAVQQRLVNLRAAHAGSQYVNVKSIG